MPQSESEVDSLANLEERIHRAVELVVSLKAERDAALSELDRGARAALAELARAHKKAAAEATGPAGGNRRGLRAERKQVRVPALKRLLGQMDQLSRPRGRYIFEFCSRRRNGFGTGTQDGAHHNILNQTYTLAATEEAGEVEMFGANEVDELMTSRSPSAPATSIPNASRLLACLHLGRPAAYYRRARPGHRSKAGWMKRRGTFRYSWIKPSTSALFFPALRFKSGSTHGIRHPPGSSCRKEKTWRVSEADPFSGGAGSRQDGVYRRR